MNVVKSTFFSIFVLIYALLLSFAVTISPIIALLLLIPLLIVVFWVAPVVHSYPKKLLMNLFFLWLGASILWPSYLSLRLPGFPGIEPSRVLLSMLIMVWMFYVMKNPNIRKNLYSTYINNTKYLLVFFFIFLIQLVAIFFSESFFQSLFYYIKVLIEVFLPALILISILSFKKDIETFLLVLAVVGGGVVLISLMEIIISKNVFLLYLPPGFVMSSEFIEQALSEKIRGGVFRVQGPFGHPLLLAQFLVVLLPVYVYLFFMGTNKGIRLISFILIPLTIVVLYKTGSRAIFVGIAVEIAVIAVLYLRLVIVTKRASTLGWIVIVSYPIFILLAMFIFYLTMDFFLGQTVSEMNSTNARFLMWEKGLSIVAGSPFFGFGSGSAAYVLGFTGRDGVLTIDSYYLSVLLESGYLGLFIFMTYLVLIFYLGIQLIRITPNNSAILFTILASLSGYLTIALILSTPHNLNILFLFSLLILLLNKESKTVENQGT